MNVLDAIMAERAADVEIDRRAVPDEALREMARGRRHHTLAGRLRDCAGTRVIAEIKKASPSAGVLCPDFKPASIVRRYEEGGACGISVLTEPRHFLGSADHLREVRAVTDLPILRKDFLCHPYQVCEAAAWGADVVLLIVAALDRKTLRCLYGAAIELGLDVLAEAHTADEVEAALELDRAIIGVNSRDLRTLKTDLRTARDLAQLIPDGRLSVAESGIRSRADIESLEAVGYKGFLIGESLLSAPDPKTMLRELQGVRS